MIKSSQNTSNWLSCESSPVQSNLAYQTRAISRGSNFLLSSCIRNLSLNPNLVGSIPRRGLLARANQTRLMSKREEEDAHQNPPAVDKLQQVVHSNSTGGWDKCWEQGLTPWDLGQPTPVISHLHRTGALPRGRALVPGCGSGYDVVEIACPERHATGLDISENAINKALELFSSLPKARYFTFLKVDFFTWHPTELFDLVFDYTFFCAIEPDMRSAWARKIADILKPDGELITLMFPTSDHIGGPPYKVSVSDYEEVLHPLGFKATSILDNELAVRPRKGREKLGRWKRSLSKSSL